MGEVMGKVGTGTDTGKGEVTGKVTESEVTVDESTTVTFRSTSIESCNWASVAEVKCTGGTGVGTVDALNSPVLEGTVDAS